MSNPNIAKFEFFPDNDILSHAKEFISVCMEIQGRGKFTVPFIINATFAIELSLQCLHAQQIYSNQWDAPSYSKSLLKSRTHSPHELYEQLPADKKLWLDMLHTEFFDSRNTSLHEELKLFHKVFIDWRYMFEGKASSVPLGLLKEMLRFFEFACSPESIARYKINLS